jgi:alanyl-tRNA synthetase
MYLQYFEEKGHTIMPSSSLVPESDPTLLLTSAGMVQMKPFFMGEAKPPNVRLTTAQKCFRTTDIDSVGNERSLTFFEMMGNFSVGDYFKREAITFAWELVTQRFKFPADKISVTVHPTDDEAYQLWRDVVGLPESKIFRDEENWWGPAGETGPCGPDSELYIDRGIEKGCGKPNCGPGCDCERFLEIWNLVFMQFYQDETGARTPLPKQNIDTGLGLERSTMLLQGKTSVYDTDLFIPIINKAAEMVGIKYGASPKTDFSLRVIADHSRAVTFLIGDGVLPGNEGRGYILRRVLRRAVRHGRSLGLTRPFLEETVSVVIELMKEAYPELAMRRDFILRVARQEEAKFNNTLSMGLNVLDNLIRDTKAKGETVIPGEAAFRLYDTFGFPKELTAELTAEQGLAIDLPGFEAAMERQRELARASAKFGLAEKGNVEAYQELGQIKTDFVGYTDLNATSEVAGMISANRVVQSVQQGDDVEIALRQTPFYAEMGGQVADMGTITGPTGKAEVRDVQKLPNGTIMHIARVVDGTIEVGDEVQAQVDTERRLAIARHHSATHLLQKALRDTLGTHVHQAGSLVEPDRLRFDFSHSAALTTEELDKVQAQVNTYIRENLPVSVIMTSYPEAVKLGAMALFGEKYGEEVRLVTMEGCSRELCGGTHVNETGQIGACFVVEETSIGSGLRRIEAVAGQAAIEYATERIGEIQRLSRRLQSANIEEKVDALQDEIQAQRKTITDLERSIATKQVDELASKAIAVDGINVLAAEVQAPNADILREMGDALRSKLQPSVVVLGAVINDRPSFIAMVSPGVNAHAGQIVKQVAAVVGGGGGGRADMAQAGGKDVSKMAEAIKLVPSLVKPKR